MSLGLLLHRYCILRNLLFLAKVHFTLHYNTFNMPRHSERAKILRDLRKINETRKAAAFMRHVMEDSSDSDCDSDEDFIEDIRDAQLIDTPRK